MATDRHILHMEVNVFGSPEVVQMQRNFETVQEVSAIVFEFIKEFAEPDAGPQTMTIVIASRRDA